MKFCVEYLSSFRYMDMADEIILDYKYNKSSEDIIEVAKTFNKDTQRLIIDISGIYNSFEAIMPILKKLQQEYPNMAVRVNALSQYQLFKDAGIPFFFRDFCSTDDEVFSYIAQGVSDIYIVNNLGFSLVRIGEYCKNKNVRVRIIPNIAQAPIHQGDYIPDICKFFVRPDDIAEYETLVDVCEIIAPADTLSVLFRVYKYDRQWLGNLKDLIAGINDDIYNSGLAPQFGHYRMICNHACMQEKCNLCKDFQTVAKSMHDLGYEIRRTNGE